MGNEIQGNQPNYYEQLQKMGVSEQQLKRLDALNGQENDQIIDKDVFTIAKSMIDKVPLEGELSMNGALCQQVQDVMRNIDLQQIKNEFDATVMTGITADTLMKGLGLSEEQAAKLQELSQQCYGNSETINRNIASAAICIVRGQPAPRGISFELNNQISNILQSTPQSNNNFGI